MYNLKRKFHSKRRLNSASSSTAGSVSDLEDRVIMLCEDIPHQTSYRARSHSEEPESGSESRVVHLSRDRQSYRQACYAERDRDREREREPARREYYVQRVVQVYGEHLLTLV